MPAGAGRDRRPRPSSDRRRPAARPEPAHPEAASGATSACAVRGRRKRRDRRGGERLRRVRVHGRRADHRRRCDRPRELVDRAAAAPTASGASAAASRDLLGHLQRAAAAAARERRAARRRCRADASLRIRDTARRAPLRPPLPRRARRGSPARAFSSARSAAPAVERRRGDVDAGREVGGDAGDHERGRRVEHREVAVRALLPVEHRARASARSWSRSPPTRCRGSARGDAEVERVDRVLVQTRRRRARARCSSWWWSARRGRRRRRTPSRARCRARAACRACASPSRRRTRRPPGGGPAPGWRAGRGS